MLSKIQIAAIAALTAASSLASAAPAAILHMQCVFTNDKIDSQIEYKDEATGRFYAYDLHLPFGELGTARLRDGAGRVIASASKSPTTRPVFAPGPDYTSRVADTLVGVLAQPLVQSKLAACGAPAGQAAHPWGPLYCPILIFVWDEDLIAQLCPWPGVPEGPHPH